MIGRSEALDRLLGIVDAVDVTTDDEPSIVLVAGEAGIGKTRLVTELLNRLPVGVVAAVGAAQPGDDSSEFGLVGSLIGVGGAELGGRDGWLDLLRAKLGEGPAVIVVEDIHWADSDSVAIIDRLAREPRSNLVMIGTYRPEDLSRRTPGGELLTRWERRRTVEQIGVGRLTRAEVADLLTAMFGVEPSSALIEAVLRRSGGNPFVIEELLACCGPDPQSVDAATLPWSLAEAMRDRLSGLSDSQRRVAEALAIGDSGAHFEVLCALTDRSEDELLDDLRAMVDRDLLVEHSIDRFGFRHALVQDAVSSQLLGRERRRLHAKALEVLTRLTPDDHAARARHAAGAGRLDEMVVLARTAAVAALASGRSFEALRLADMALQEAPDDVELLAVSAQAAWLVDLSDEAVTSAGRLYDIARATGDEHVLATALRWTSRLAFEQGRPDELTASLGEMVTLAERMSPTPSRAELVAHIAQMHMLIGSNAEAVAWADRAIAEAALLGLGAVRRQAMVERGSARVSLVGLAARDELLNAADEAAAAGEWVLASRGLNNLLGIVPSTTPAGDALMAKLNAARDRSGFDALSCGLDAVRARQALVSGDLPALRRILNAERSRRGNAHRMSAEARVMDATIAIEEGCTEAAQVLLNALLAESDNGLTRRTCRPYCRLALMSITTASSDERSAALFSVIDTLAINDESSLTQYLTTAEDALAAGISPAEVAERLLPVVDTDVSAGTIRGLMAAAEGRHVDVVAFLAPIVAAPSAYLHRPQLGSLRTILAEAYVAVGERSLALAQLREAVETDLSRWPGRRRDRAEALLGTLDRPTRSSRASSALTSREVEVVAELARGLTNSELARQLYISPKTAAVHVSNILMKLNMTNRAEVAAWAVRSGLA